MKIRSAPGFAITVLAAGLLTACSTQPVATHDKLDLTQLLDDSSEFQRDILTDGDVTAAEYERALLAHSDCVADAGAVPGEIYEIGNGELTFDYEVFAANDDARIEIETRAEKCRPEYFEQVGLLWAYQQLLTPAERDHARPKVLACLAKTGLTKLPDDADLETVVSAIRDDGEVSEEEQACINSNVAFFSTWSNDHAEH